MRNVSIAKIGSSLLGVLVLHGAALAQQVIPGASLASGMAEPLGVSRVVFVTKKVEKFGEFQPRANAVFKPGEPIVLYVEPSGFIFPSENGGARGDMGVVLKVATADGRVLLERPMTNKQNNPKGITNTFSNFNITLSAAGKYAVSITMTDNLTGRSLQYTVPLVVQAP
jgi:hypothetical protein